MAVRLPVDLLRKYGLHVGDLLEVEDTPNKLVLKPITVKSKYALQELIAQCDRESPESEELKAWHDMKPVGREK